MSVASEVTTYHQQDGSTRVHRDDDRCEHRFPLHRVHVFTDVELAAHDAEVAARTLGSVEEALKAEADAANDPLRQRGRDLWGLTVAQRILATARADAARAFPETYRRLGATLKDPE